MNLLAAGMHGVVAAAAAALVASIWQGVVLIALVTICLRCVRRLSAAARSAIWTGALLLVVSLPVLALVPARGMEAGGGASISRIHVRETWSFAILGVWVLVSTVRGVALVRSGLALRRIARNAVPVKVDAVVAGLLRSARGEVELCASAEVKRPCLAGFFRPRILMPASLLATLSVAELEQVVLHEMEHLRRRDDWINLLQQASLVLCPLHPAVLWVDRRLTTERELACDDGVLRMTGARKAYAACLARIAEHALFSQGVSLALALVGRRGKRSEISRRVQRILRSPERVMSGVPLRLMMGVVTAAAVVAVGVMARSPRLVSFAPTGGAVHGAVQTAAVEVPFVPSSTMRGADMHAAGLHAAGPHAAGPHAAMVKAVMPAGPAAIPRTMRGSARAMPSRDAGPNRMMRREGIDLAPQLVLTGWRSRQQNVRPTLTDFQGTVFQDSQAAYAAIRFGDGWLIVQL